MSDKAVLTVRATPPPPPKWQLLDDGDPPPPVNSNPSLVFDSARGVALQTRHSPSGQLITWELQGADWVRKVIPGPNVGLPCAAFDTDRGVTVLFGGTSGPGPVLTNETWEYDGVAWQQRFPAMSPPVREWCGMAYDANRQVMVLFGGYGAAGFFGTSDTWEYDGANWVEVPLSFGNRPSGRGEPAMTYDSGRQEVVLFGGRFLNTVYSDTWTYDGNKWTMKIPGGSPSARASAGLVFDPGLGKTILFGGGSPVQTFGDTWEWNGAAWTQRFPASSPPARRCKAVYDTVRQQVLVHGGNFGSGGYNDTWV